MNENVMGKQVVDAAVKVHRELGPGQLETVYEVVLARERETRIQAEPSATPNGGPAGAATNSGVCGGPPSVT